MGPAVGIRAEKSSREATQVNLVRVPFAAGHSIERVWRRRTVAAGAVALTGVMLLVVGLVITQTALVVGVIVSIVGFLAMVGSAAFFIRRPCG